MRIAHARGRGTPAAFLGIGIGNDAVPSMGLIIFQRETGIGLS
jgi:hypothetical protein